MVKQICFYLLAKKKRLIKALDQERTILVPPPALVEYMAITLKMSKEPGLYSVILNNNFSITLTSGANSQVQSLLKSLIGMHIQIKT